MRDALFVQGVAQQSYLSQVAPFGLNCVVMIAPLSLSNLLTVIIAIMCLSTIASQSRGDVVKLWRLAVPACLAVAQALVLLASVIDATFIHDAEWVLAAVVGAIAGRMRGWTMFLQVDQARDLFRARRSYDGQIAAIGLVIFAFTDFVSAALEDPIVDEAHIAAGSALCAGYLTYRAIAVAVRAARLHHVELIETLQGTDTTARINS
jgi:hypothetical protein